MISSISQNAHKRKERDYDTQSESSSQGSVDETEILKVADIKHSRIIDDNYDIRKKASNASQSGSEEKGKEERQKKKSDTISSSVSSKVQSHSHSQPHFQLNIPKLLTTILKQQEEQLSDESKNNNLPPLPSVSKRPNILEILNSFIGQYVQYEQEEKKNENTQESSKITLPIYSVIKVRFRS